MTQKPAHAPDDALCAKVRAHIAGFRRDNGGADPTRSQVAAALKRRKADISSAMRQIEENDAAEAGRLGALPDIPEQVTDAGATLVNQIWIAAHETASLALSEVRSRLADMQARQRRQLDDTEGLLAETEDELEAALARAVAAETALAELRTTHAELAAQLSKAEAKLDDRAEIIALVQAQMSERPEKPERTSKRAKDAESILVLPQMFDSSRPQTGDLPLGISP